MLPTLTLNVLLDAQENVSLVRGRNDDTPVTVQRLVVGDQRPIRIRLLRRDPEDDTQLVIAEEYQSDNLSIAGRALDGLGSEDPLLFLTESFTVHEDSENGTLVDRYYEGILDTHTEEAQAAVGADPSIRILTEIRLRDGLAENRVAVSIQTGNLVRDIYRGDEGEPGSADPPYITADQVQAIFDSGDADLTVKSLTVTEPGLITQSTAVALIDDGALIVPTPNTGNTLLIERDGGVGTTTVSTVSGLVPGAIYLLKNMDGGTLALAGDLNDSDSVDLPDGKTCWLYADTETTGHIIGWHLEETA